MPDFKKSAIASAWLAAVLVVAMYIVNYVFTLIKLTPTTLFTSFPTPVSPISGTIGAKILNMFAGIIPVTLDIPSIAVLFISAWASILVGTYLIAYGLPVVGKTRWAKVAWTVIWGAAAFYLLIVGIKLITINQAIGLIIYTVPAAYVAVWIGNMFGLTDKF